MPYIFIPPDAIQEYVEEEVSDEEIHRFLLPLVDRVIEKNPRIGRALSLRIGLGESVIEHLVEQDREQPETPDLPDTLTSTYIDQLVLRTREILFSEGDHLVSFASGIQEIIKENNSTRPDMSLAFTVPFRTARYLAYLLGLVFYVKRDLLEQITLGDNNAI